MEKIKVLIVSGKLTIEHTYRETNERIRTLLESTGRFDVKITEAFGGVRKCPGTDPKVLVTVFYDVKFYDVPWWPPAHHPVHIPDGDKNKLPGVNTDIPLAWKNTYGKGRVFGCSIGHGIDTFRRFDYVGLFVRGCEWAATGSVTLDKPDRSGDNRLKPWPYY